MKKKQLLEQIKKAAQKDEQNRKNIKYKRAMAFLTRKGFLKTNVNFHKYYLAKINVMDLLWAGKNVEPRILEVLPAAIARLPKAIKFIGQHKEGYALNLVVEDLKLNKKTGHDFLNIPYNKMRIWMDLHLNDHRTKTINQKKILKTFRLSPQTIQKLEELKVKNGISTDAKLIEYLVND